MESKAFLYIKIKLKFEVLAESIIIDCILTSFLDEITQAMEPVIQTIEQSGLADTIVASLNSEVTRLRNVIHQRRNNHRQLVGENDRLMGENLRLTTTLANKAQEFDTLRQLCRQLADEGAQMARQVRDSDARIFELELIVGAVQNEQSEEKIDEQIGGRILAPILAPIRIPQSPRTELIQLFDPFH
uniref:Uncharacterized protein n=1 Tax=Mimivirus LCMiAC01 TaxID=2506608 RepID=A0A481Z265_9VIRU|nr:MAG: hypothetical protein LCMiAC01_05460 [Mimivirus LCMiAC01]